MAEETELANIKGTLGTTKSEDRYLRDRLDVSAQRRKVLNVQTQVTLAKRAFDRVSAGDPNYQRLADAYKKAVNDLNDVKTELNRIEGSARSDYRKAYTAQEKKKGAEESKTIDRQIEVEQNVLKRLQDSGQSTAAQRAKIQDLIDKKNGTGKYAPPSTVVQTEGGTTNTSADITTLMAEAPLALSKMTDKQRKLLSQSLKEAGYNVPVTGVYNDFLRNAYVDALSQNNIRNEQTKQNQSLPEFLITKSKEPGGAFFAGGAGGKGGGLPQGSVNISTTTEAAGIISQIFENEIGRLPTPKELRQFTDDLIKEEKKFSSVVRPVKRVVNGVEVTEYVGGLDRNQFLADKVRKLPEYDIRKQAAQALTKDALAKTARANGLNLDKDFGDVAKGWIKRVEAGEDIAIFQNLIRGTAKLGMPQNVQALMDNGLDLDAVYAPYKRVMASNLEIMPDSINLNDPLLRTAIGPDKEMSIYDFEKQIRKDNRWQYTNKAREEVADATMRVLRDFGLMG